MKLSDKLKDKQKQVIGKPGLGILTSLGDEDMIDIKNEINIDLIDFSALNFYNQLDTEEDIRDLADSIKEIGLLHNIVVIPNNKGRYTVISGEKRVKAFKLLLKDTKDSKWKHIPCKIRDDIKSAADEELALIRANRDVRERNDLIKAREVERLDVRYAEKKAAGEKVGIIRKRIAEEMNISETQVQRLRTVNELIPEFKKMLETGDIPLTTVEHFTGFDPDIQKDIFKSITNLGHKVSRDEAQEIKNEIKATIDGAVNISEPAPAAGKKIKDSINKIKAEVDISQHIKKALNSVKTLAAKIEDLTRNEKNLSDENKDAINKIKELLNGINI